MRIIKLHTGRLKTNTYIVCSQNDKDCFIIDPGGSLSLIEETIEENGLTLKAVLLTHEHFDHCFFASNFQKKGAKVYAHKNAVINFGNEIHKRGANFNIAIEDFTVDYALEDNEIFEVCGHEIKVLHTPGHTSGSVCYILDDIIFSGDTLFKGTVGRTDFPTGSYEQILNSLKTKLLPLEQNYKIYPGHEQESTLEYEKTNNQYFQLCR